MKKNFLAGAISLACIALYGCGGGSSGGSNNNGGNDGSGGDIVIDGTASSVEELQAELTAAESGATITLTGDISSNDPIIFTLDKSVTIDGGTSALVSTAADGDKATISGNVCFDIPNEADGHTGITIKNLHFEDIEMVAGSDGQSCGSEAEGGSRSRSIINIGKVAGDDGEFVTLDNLSFDGSGFDELNGNPTAWVYSRGLVKVTNSTFTDKQVSSAANSIIYLNCGSVRADGSLFDDNTFSLGETSADVTGVWVGQFDEKSCGASVTNNTFANFENDTTDKENTYAAIVDGSADDTVISGNNFGDGEVTDPEPELPGDIVAPYALSAFQNVISQSQLQRWDPEVSGSETKISISNETIAQDTYYDDYFYAYDGSKEMVFYMRGESLRSELRVENNFFVTDAGYTMSASFQPIGIAEAIELSTNGDEVTFLQVHNKGINDDGDENIPHPLLRVVYDADREGTIGHYWAVIKTNALDCSTGSSDYGSSACDNAYQRFDLGEANLDEMTDIDVSVGNNRLVITVEGEEIVDYDISYWEHLKSYFKAGVYNQYESDAWSEVRFSKLTVTENSEEVLPTTGWDIDLWKITIPASKDDWYGTGGSEAAEVVPAFCDDNSKDVLSDDADLIYREYESDISFFNVLDGRMHFRADMGYGTSTANSDYIRSELRELFNAQQLNTCSTGNSSAMTSWYINDEATGTTTHKLTSVLSIDEYPEISGQEPKVIVGQVHGWEIKQALIKVLWEGENTPVRVVMNQDFFTGNVACSDNTDGCDDWPFSIELGTYAANTDWQYVIQVDEEGIYLATADESGSNVNHKQIVWGQAFEDKDGNQVTMSTRWKGDDIAYYFKAGIYPQFKPDTAYAGKRFDVSFSTVNLEHK